MPIGAHYVSEGAFACRRQDELLELLPGQVATLLLINNVKDLLNV